MKNKSILWYTRKNGAVKGPFTSAIIRNELILSRLSLHDEVSENQVDWYLILNLSEFSIHLNQDNHIIRQKSLDERDGFDRRNNEHQPSQHAYVRGHDRRKKEPTREIERRQAQTHVIRAWRNQQERFFWPLVLIFSLLFTTLLLAILYAKPLPVPQANCTSAAAPHINWNNCLKPKRDLRNRDLSEIQLRNSQLVGSNLINSTLSNADLAYADLRFTALNYSNLSNSLLLGANLKNADLSHADLSNADFSYTDLRDANLGGALLNNTRFDHAIWLDGSLCGINSIDQCESVTPEH
jgi:uncharacterized protein YjbI with pentapeptide repeats